MEMDVIRQLEEQMKIFGIQVIRLRTGDPEETEFDLGLRRALGIRRDSGADLKMMADLLEEDTLYFIRDVFGVHYICLRLPGQDAGDETACFLHIGPYLTGDRETVWEETVKKSDLSVCQRQELRHYYDRLPLPASEEELERLVILQTGYLLGNSDVSINRLENFYGAQMRPKDVLVENDSELSIKMVEERYQQEEWLLQAIRPVIFLPGATSPSIVPSGKAVAAENEKSDDQQQHPVSQSSAGGGRASGLYPSAVRGFCGTNRTVRDAQAIGGTGQGNEAKILSSGA